MKRLVLFSDGTGNSSAKAQKTNVWRMFQALDQTTADQLAKYDDGVGTSSNKYLAAAGGAFGYGLKRNVIDLYKFICRNYVAGDKIYGFGFSRGAFTIRVVMAMIATEGLVKGRSESELHANALAAYREYRAKRFPSYSPLVWIGRALRDYVLMPWSAQARRRHRQSALPNSVPIEFLGLWDTVGAYGMPIDELKWGFDKIIWPMVAVDTHLLDPIKRCCHALALDEQRQTFTPTLFDETFEAAEVAAARKPSGRLTQVWFAGVHSNVGGGYPEDRLSLVALDWMMSQAIDAGLRFDPAAVPDIAIERSGFARLYDSRAGVAAYYRYRPRTIDMGRYPNGEPILAIVHGSVVMRLARGSDAYAPISLPAEFDVLAPNGQLIDMHGFPYANRTLAMRDDRPKSSVAADPVIDERMEALKTAIEDLQRAPPEAEMVEQVRDTVWWRRVTYFGTLAATLALVGFPFASGLYASIIDKVVGLLGAGLATGLHESIAHLDQYARSAVGEATSAAAHVLPSYAGLWLHALARQPLEMITAIVLVAIPYAAGNFLGSRIHDRAWFAWHPRRRADYIDWARESFRRSVITAVGVTLALGVVTWWAHARPLADTLIGLIQLAFVVSAAVLAWRLILVARLALHRRHESRRVAKLPITPMLWVARKLRYAGWLNAIYRVMGEKVVPIAVASLLLVAIAAALLHATYFTEHAAGLYCDATAGQSHRTPAGGTALTQAGFATSDPCWASGIVVVAERRYHVELQVDSDEGWWFDRLQRTDPGGFPGSDVKHVLAAPLKRIWAAHWFAPVVRVGHLGVDDLVMTPDCLPDSRCDERPYDRALDDGTVPAFSPIPASVARDLVSKDPRPHAARKATLDFTAQHDGELYIYVNDAVLPIPPEGGPFYRNNSGRARLSVTDVTDCGVKPSCDPSKPAVLR
jgi:uncharacterized protein (DUF2235 family)